LLAPAHRRDDAVGALRVAAHRDLYPGLERALSLGGEMPGELRPLGEAAAGDGLAAARAEPVREMADRARAEGDVDERVELEQALPLGLGIAAADGDRLLGVALLERARLGEVRSEPLVGLLADRAGVEDEHVGLVLRRRLSEAKLLEQALDPLGVVSVHLT